MSWYYNSQPLIEIPEKAFGFIYVITYMTTGQKYLGRKQFWSTKTKTIKGKKKRLKVESDWREYYSSSPDLKKLIEEVGRDKFRRDIIMMVESKSELLYAEEYFLYQTHAMLSDQWLNANIRTKILKSWFTKNRDSFLSRILFSNLEPK